MTSRTVLRKAAVILALSLYGAVTMPLQHVSGDDIVPLYPDAPGFFYGGDGDDFPDKLATAINEPFVRDADFIDIWSSVITPKQIRALKQLKSLEGIRFWTGDFGVTLSTETIDEFSSLSHVKWIQMLARCPETTSWKGLQHLRSLEDLEIQRMDTPIYLRQADMDAVGNLSNLISLTLHCRVRCHDYRWLSRLKKLESLTMYLDETNGDIYNNVKNLENLRDLNIEARDKATRLELETLAAGSGKLLNTISFGKFDEQCLSVLSQFHSVRSLYVRVEGQSECDLAFAKNLQHLRELGMSGGKISPSQILQLEGHPTLEKISFIPTGDPTELRKTLLRLPNLETVFFYDTVDSRLDDKHKQLMKDMNKILEARRAEREKESTENE